MPNKKPSNAQPRRPAMLSIAIYAVFTALQGLSQGIFDFSVLPLYCRARHWRGADGRAPAAGRDPRRNPPRENRRDHDDPRRPRHLYRRLDLRARRRLWLAVRVLCQHRAGNPPRRPSSACTRLCGRPRSAAPTTPLAVVTICARNPSSGPNAGLTEVLIPAGHVTTVCDPIFALSPDGVSVPSDRPHHFAAARPPLLAGVSRRARQGRRAPQDRLLLRSCLAAPHPAARLRPAVRCRGRSFAGLGTRLSRAVRLCDRPLVSGKS
jgi:hypothetical protein